MHAITSIAFATERRTKVRFSRKKQAFWDIHALITQCFQEDSYSEAQTQEKNVQFNNTHRGGRWTRWFYGNAGFFDYIKRIRGQKGKEGFASTLLLDIVSFVGSLKNALKRENMSRLGNSDDHSGYGVELNLIHKRSLGPSVMIMKLFLQWQGPLGALGGIPHWRQPPS